MAKREPTQKTQPQPRKKGKDKLPEPIDIPIPTKQDVMGDLAKTARPKSQQKPRKLRRRRTVKTQP